MFISYSHLDRDRKRNLTYTENLIMHKVNNGSKEQKSHH